MSKSNKFGQDIILLYGKELLVSANRQHSNIRRVELNGCHSGKLSIINWPKYLNDVNEDNIKISNGNISKTNEFNIKQDALTSFISKYDNIMVLAGAGSSIAKGLNNSQYNYNEKSHGIYTYHLAAEINDNLEHFNKIKKSHRIYNLIDMAHISHFCQCKELDKQKSLINKNLNQLKDNNYNKYIIKKHKVLKILIFSNFRLFLSIINYFSHFLDNGLIKESDYSTKKYQMTVKVINKLKVCKERYHKRMVKSNIQSGLIVSHLARKINNELNIINKELGYDKYYNLLQLAIRFHFDGVHKNNKKNRATIFKNFEDLSSEINEFYNFIGLSNKFKKDKYSRTIKKIHYLIRKYCTLKLNNKYFDHFNFIHKLQLLNDDNNRLKIYSTNYDTLFEQAADENNSIIIDGFNYSANRSFKNDAMNIDFINKQNDSSHPDSSNINVHKNVVKIFQLHGSTNWYRTNRGVYKTTTDIANTKINDNEGKTCMIFPSSKKYAQTYKDPYFDLFFNFQKDLHKKNTLLIVVGFSFGDMHIRRMVYDAMISNKSLSMIFVGHDGVKSKKKNNDLYIKSPNLKEFFNSGLLSRELFFKGDLLDFTNALDLDAIHNK